MTKNKGNHSKFTADSHLQCPDCHSNIHVGTGGTRNLTSHIGSHTCKNNQRIAARASKPKEKSLFSFFGQKSRQNPPRVASSPPVESAPIISHSSHPSEEALITTQGDDDMPLEPCVANDPTLTGVVPPPDNPGIRQGRRVLKRVLVQDSSCDCDAEITAEEKEGGTQVMECKARGCETGWFHLSCMAFTFVPRNWICPNCKASKRHRN